jgi:Uma2 family endonuclease
VSYSNDVTAQPHEPLTQAEFLAWELQQPDKHEFVDGYVYPLFGDATAQGFAGGTGWHNRLALELALVIAPAARPCRTYTSDMRIETARSTRYADLFVTCDERDHDDASVMRHPKLIVEVLSESTAREDLGPKKREYESIDTLNEYLVIDSRKRWAQVIRREGGEWVESAPSGSGLLELKSLGLILNLDEVYDAVGSPQQASG